MAHDVHDDGGTTGRPLAAAVESVTEALETIAAIRSGRIDAFVVVTPGGERIVLIEGGAERPYRAIFDGMKDGAATVALDGTILYANRSLRVMLEAPGDTLVARDFFDFCDHVRGESLQAAFDHGVHARWCGDTVLQSYDGGDVPVWLSLTPMRGEDGSTVLSMLVTDLRERRRLERHSGQQRATAELGRLALTGVTLLELARACEAALSEQIPAAAVTLTGPLVGGEHAAEPVRDADDGDGLRRTVRSHGTTFGEVQVRTNRETPLTADDVDFVDNVVSLLSLAAEHQVLHERLRHQAHHDDLTKLPNRVLLEDRLQQTMAHATRDGHMVAVMFIDLDRFKLINDSLGHQAGNEVLIQVAHRLSARLRETDTVSRLGGDEFVLVHGGLQRLDDATEVARAVTAALGRPFHVNGHTVSVRATVGISVFPRDGHDTETLITRADKAMYYGKRGGRNTVQYFTGVMDAFTAAQLEMEHDLQAALEQGQLELHFQARSCPRTGKLKGLEALARWRHPEHGWIPPARFVPVAEEMGFVVDLGSWAMREACRQAARWKPSDDGGLRVSVNISPNHLARPDFVTSVQAALDASGLVPRRLELEVTESIMMHDIPSVTRVLTSLRQLGVQIALDDFGLGYSSVSYLRSLPLDRLKIDKSFLDATTDHLDARHDQVAVLSAVGTMAQALGLQVTLEGVETPFHLRVARGMGCDEVQGHLFGHAVPADGVMDLVERWPHRSWRG